MQLVVNGETRRLDGFDPGVTLQRVLEVLGYEPKSIAVAINGQFVARHRYATHPVTELTELEIVAPMQGG